MSNERQGISTSAPSMVHSLNTMPADQASIEPTIHTASDAKCQAEKKLRTVCKVVDPCDLAALAMDLLNHNFHNHATQCLP